MKVLPESLTILDSLAPGAPADRFAGRRVLIVEFYSK